MRNARSRRVALTTAIAMPWHTTHPSLRWIGGVVYLLLCIGALACALLIPGRHGWLYGMVVYGFGAAYFWQWVMAALLLVSIDTHRLRIPGVGRSTATCLGLYAAATIALPAAVFAARGGEASTVALFTALAMVAGVASVLLRRRYVMALAFLPALAVGLRPAIQLPFPGQPGFLVWGTAVLIVLLAVDVLRWRHLLRADDTREDDAQIVRYGRRGALGGLGAAPHAGAPRRASVAPTPLRLAGVGPGKPVLALRVALGEGYAPQGLRGHARRFTRFGLPLLLYVPAMAIVHAGEAHGDPLRQVLFGVGIDVIGWLGIMGGLMLMLMGSLLPWASWRRRRPELALLALLPGLGGTVAARHALLRATLGRPLMLQTGLLALVLTAALLLHAHATLLLFVVLSQLGCVATVAATSLGVFGGCPLPGWGMALVLAGMAVLVSASTFVPLFATLGHHPWHAEHAVFAALAVAWIVAAGALGWLGRRGWQGMRARPHPFLAV